MKNWNGKKTKIISCNRYKFLIWLSKDFIDMKYILLSLFSCFVLTENFLVILWSHYLLRRTDEDGNLVSQLSIGFDSSANVDLSDIDAGLRRIQAAITEQISSVTGQNVTAEEIGALYKCANEGGTIISTLPFCFTTAILNRNKHFNF